MNKPFLMKNIALTLLTLFFISVAVAQDTETPVDSTSYTTSNYMFDSTEVKPKNILKTNLSSIVFRNFSLTYERILTKRFSLSLGVRWMPDGGIPLIKTVEKVIGEESEDSTDEDLDDFNNNTTISGIAITLEPRFYIGKGHGKGFYFAPYYRYSNFKFGDITVNYDNEFNEEKEAFIGGTINAHSIGLMIGSQFNLGKNLVLDWWIIGGHYGKSSGTISGTPESPLSEYEQQEVKDSLEDIALSNYIKEVNVDSTGIEVLIDGPWVGVRAFGFSLGYRF